jgi:hypothetical protein
LNPHLFAAPITQFTGPEKAQKPELASEAANSACKPSPWLLRL